MNVIGVTLTNTPINKYFNYFVIDDILICKFYIVKFWSLM